MHHVPHLHGAPPAPPEATRVLVGPDRPLELGGGLSEKGFSPRHNDQHPREIAVEPGKVGSPEVGIPALAHVPLPLTSP